MRCGPFNNSTSAGSSIAVRISPGPPQPTDIIHSAASSVSQVSPFFSTGHLCVVSPIESMLLESYYLILLNPIYFQ